MALSLLMPPHASNLHAAAAGTARPVTPEDELVARALARDAVATNALFRRHLGPVLALVTRLVGRTSDAEDVAQDALATALAELPSLRNPSAFGPWLRAIAVRQAHRYFRRRRLRRLLGLDRGIDDATLAQLAAPGISPEQRAILASVDAVLATLPTAQRIAWCLRHVEGDALDEVAAACGCSLATAKRRIAAAHEAITRKSPVFTEAP